MSGNSNHQFKNPVVNWLDTRLPIFSLVKVQAMDFPTPKNLNYWWTFGGILAIMLVIQLITGIVLVMHYTPTTDLAFASVENIMRDVNYGWLLRYLHANGASMFFLAVYIHIFRGMYYGSYKEPREVLWMLGVFIFIVMMATAFMGYVLPWGQMSFWGAKVITSLFSAIPYVGDPIVTWLWGGFNVGDPTLNRFFSLHYLLPFVLVALVFLHIWALHVPGNSNPTGVEVKSDADTVPFHPYYTIKDLYAIMLFMMLLAAFVFFAPNFMGHPDNYNEANSLVTPSNIVPEWYFLPFYAILRAIPDKLFGVIAMFSSLLVLLALPWLDSSKVRSGKYRPLFKQFYWLFILNFIVLAVVGGNPPVGAWVTIGQISTGYYFFHLLILLPVLGLIEKPKPLPASISEDVLASSKSKS